MIKQLDISDLPYAVEVIRKSFMTVADELNLTEQNCPKHVAFATTLERLEGQFNWGLINRGWLYGLYDNEQLVGYVSICKTYGTNNIYEIHNLSVLPEYRHKGYGRQLLDFCKIKLKELETVNKNI